jgi:hypothetical protein
MTQKSKYEELRPTSISQTQNFRTLLCRKKTPSSKVIFLGEKHRDVFDEQFTEEILMTPPIFNTGQTGVIFERGLDNRYILSRIWQGQYQRTEPFIEHLTPNARNKHIAEMIIDAFSNHDQNVIYMVCGSRHSKGIFDVMSKKCTRNFIYISKLSHTD